MAGETLLFLYRQVVHPRRRGFRIRETVCKYRANSNALALLVVFTSDNDKLSEVNFFTRFYYCEAMYYKVFSFLFLYMRKY